MNRSMTIHEAWLKGFTIVRFGNYEYDPADDGPEVEILRQFYANRTRWHGYDFRRTNCDSNS
jgi:hypothetical protein